jgi:hypothetical protein
MRGLLDVPAALDPIGGGHLDADGLVCWHLAAHDVEHLERKAYAVLERSAVSIGALVGDRREELVPQITVRAMDLDAVHAQAYRRPCGRRERLADACIPAALSAAGAASPSFCGSAEGTTGAQPPARSVLRP